MNNKLLKVATAVAVSLSLWACSKTPEKQAQALIEEYMQTHLNDPASFEVVKYSNLAERTPMARAMVLITNEDIARHQSDSIDAHLARFKESYTKKGKDPYEVIGREMTCEFRAANAFGAKVLQEKTFVFNPEVTSIVAVE